MTTIIIVNNRRQFDAILCDKGIAAIVTGGKPICVVAKSFDYDALRGQRNCTIILGDAWDKNLTSGQRQVWKEVLWPMIQRDDVNLIRSRL